MSSSPRGASLFVETGFLHGPKTLHVARLLADAGFRNFHQHRFLYGLNNLYIARK